MASAPSLHRSRSGSFSAASLPATSAGARRHTVVGTDLVGAADPAAKPSLLRAGSAAGLGEAARPSSKGSVSSGVRDEDRQNLPALDKRGRRATVSGATAGFIPGRLPAEGGGGVPSRRRASVGDVAGTVDIAMRFRRSVADAQERRNLEIYEEARAEASAALADAVEKQDMGELLAAISQAKQRGAPKASVDEATAVLQRLQADEGLRRAMKARDLEELKGALARAKQYGVAKSRLFEAEKLHDFLNAEDALRLALGTRESGAVKLAIGLALNQGVQNDDLKEAQKLFSLMELQSLFNTAAKREDPKKLEEALQRAEQMGVDERNLVDARKLLADLEGTSPPGTEAKGDSTAGKRRSSFGGEEDEVIENLKRAIDLQETGALSMTLESAKKTQLTLKAMSEAAALEIASKRQPWIDKAQLLLDQIQTARFLSSAIKAKDQKKLKDALKRAQACELRSSDVDQAASLLAHFDAKDALSSAMKKKQLEDLRPAIDKAREAGVERTKIEHAEQIFNQLEAREQLAAAVETQEPEAIAAAVAIAKTKGVDRDTVEKAAKMLQPEPERLRRKSVSVLDDSPPKPGRRISVVTG